ncbi:hypothetical protein GIB67_041210 [Kingdonia uniflora]|uniref:Uncharacterized protein n=1 Tax=Kingdonia uniflora TaxID=39325 RepID=A0A7J7MCS2_9MAGN|nr:hypothetical protein GIB67_041210 [Kingdonia uniflora]
MASGLGRIALESDKRGREEGEVTRGITLEKLLQWEEMWGSDKARMWSEELKVLKAIGPVSRAQACFRERGRVGGELMYMRAKYERVVGSKDSETFYMRTLMAMEVLNLVFTCIESKL